MVAQIPLMALGMMVPSVSNLISKKWGEKRTAEQEAAWEQETFDMDRRGSRSEIGEFGQTPSGRVPTIGSSPGNTQASRERTAASTGRMFNTPTSFFGEPTAPVDFGQSAGGGAPMMPTPRPLTQTPMQPAQPNYLAPPQTNIAQAQPTANNRQFIPMIDMPPPQELENIPAPGAPVIDSVLSGGAATPSMPPPQPVLPPPAMNEMPSSSGGPLSQDELRRVSAYGASVAPSQQSQGQIEDAFTDPRNPLGPGAKPYIEKDIEGVNRLNEARAKIVGQYGELTPRQEADYGARLSRLSGTGPEERVTVQNETGYRTTVPQRNIQYLNPGWSFANDTSQIKEPTEQQAPEVVELYDDSGVYKAFWNSDTAKFERIGGVKPPQESTAEVRGVVPLNGTLSDAAYFRIDSPDYLAAMQDGMDVRDFRTTSKAQEANRKERILTGNQVAAEIQPLKLVLASVRKIIDNPDTSDVTGSLDSSMFFPTSGLNFASDNVSAATEIENLNNLAKNVGMQMTRQASPTGSAGGTISEKEWPIMAARVGNLNISQSDENFLKEMKKIEVDMTDMIKRLTESHASLYPDIGTGSGTDNGVTINWEELLG